MHFTIGHLTKPIVAVFIFFLPLVKCSFLFLRKINFSKERFTIGIVKLPIVKLVKLVKLVPSK